MGALTKNGRVFSYYVEDGGEKSDIRERNYVMF